MNPNSPGYDSIDDDIEMIGIHEAQDSHTTQEKPPMYASTRSSESDSEDEEETHQDDGSRALLSGSAERTRGREPPLEPSQKIWPQVKGIVMESAPALLMTTISLTFTGKLLDKVSHWQAMQQVDQLIMIIPVVLNLNGNLEMNLSARLATAANVGELDDPAVQRAMIIGSLALLQVQTISVSFLASCVALLLGRVVPRTSPAPSTASGSPSNSTVAAAREILTTVLESRDSSYETTGRRSGIPTFIMVASTAMTAAALSGLILGSFMCTLIVLCRKFNRDPDNIAPAVASCLGDLFTLILLGVVATILVPFLHTPIPFIIGLCIACTAIGCLIYTLKNQHVRPLITEGWSPLFLAMIISSGTGIVLDMFVSRYEGFAVLAVVISGLPGAAGSILISRLSTALHATALAAKNSLPSYSSPARKPEPSPILAMLTLLVITIPVEIIFLSILNGLGWLNLHILFVVFSIIFFCCAVSISTIFPAPNIWLTYNFVFDVIFKSHSERQVLASLVIARYLTNFLWSINRDPDMYALPIHSALMDLIGQLLLVLCFEIVSTLGAKFKMRT
ncbi:hypothetical protein CVT24_008672 [Panaeolus cyanescens]|uniref:SLC41A/MgtE integral membrane domain-containing protein n=1 Tax=Panaeolus cyanescens TaxID=181874 RepID=A0A409WEI8_9AGAR|nr:hypothetical protein CVT24_008672 [Panaeolus cyanescens]